MVYLGRKTERIPITWESLFWFAVLTTVGTVVGTWLYVQYIEPGQLAALNKQAGAGSPAIPSLP